MGLGSFRWRLLFILIAILLLWQCAKIWLTFMQDQSIVQAPPQVNRMVTINQEDSAKEIVKITVYYEALCPDSRGFFVKQLLPTYLTLKDHLQIHLVPYGKATTHVMDHNYEFTCQHGPVECQANMIHACAIDVINNQTLQLNYMCCMIKNNMEPVDIMDICAEKMNVDRDPIFACYSGTKGKELLAKCGELTDAVTPRITFIPTVTINDEIDNQAKILKNLLQEVCSRFKVKPVGCISHEPYST